MDIPAEVTVLKELSEAYPQYRFYRDGFNEQRFFITDTDGCWLASVEGDVLLLYSEVEGLENARPNS